MRICLNELCPILNCAGICALWYAVPTVAHPFLSHGHQDPSYAGGGGASCREGEEEVAERCGHPSRGAALRVPAYVRCSSTCVACVCAHECEAMHVQGPVSCGAHVKKLLNHAYSAGLAWAYSEM